MVNHIQRSPTRPCRYAVFGNSEHVLAELVDMSIAGDDVPAP